MLLGEVCTGQHQLPVDFQELLLTDRGASRRAGQVVLGPVHLHGPLGLPHPPAQRGQAFVEPVRSAPGGLELRLQLRHEVAIGQSIGDPGRLHGVLGCEGNRNHEGEPTQPRDLQRVRERLKDRRLLALTPFLLCDHVQLAWNQARHPLQRVRDGRTLVQSRVELGVPVELQLLDHRSQQRARSNHLDLALDGGGLRGEAGHDPLQIGHIAFTGIDEDLRCRRVEGSELESDQQYDRSDQQHAADDNSDSPSQNPENLRELQLDFVLGRFVPGLRRYV